MSRGAGHLSVRQGKRVIVYLKNGDNFISRFNHRTDRYVHFYDRKPILTRQIKTLTIFKPMKDKV